MKYASIAALSALSMMMLSACSTGTVKETLGLERAAPDEFRVISRPPLSVPPQFSLRPPSNSDATPNQLTADKKARSIINGKEDTSAAGNADTAVIPVTETKRGKHGKTVVSDSGVSTGAESQFLKNAGASSADPKVRDALVDEKFEIQEKKEERSWWDITSVWDDKKDPQVDAKGEAQRLKKNADEGKPVTEGNTPEVKAKDEGILNSILH